MGKIDCLLKKFRKKPIPNDIMYKDVVTLFEHFGCIISTGGNHPKVVCKENGTVIPIAGHNREVGEYNIKQLNELLDDILEEEK